MSEPTVVLVAHEPLPRPLDEALRAAGCEVLSPGSVEAAMATLGARRVDVLLLHGRDSAETAGFLPVAVARAPATAAVVLSRVASVRDGVEAMKHGAVDFLMSTCAPEALEAAVARAACIARMRRSIAERAEPARRELLVGPSQAMQHVRDLVARVAASGGGTVLVEGETGTGKEMVAEALQTSGPRRDRPFLRLNCAALVDTLFESALFGHERGAFTGAVEARAGILEAASGGTVLLDEIGDLPLPAQAKLLRFLETRQYRRVGGVEERSADIQITAATHRDLDALLASGAFRSDLYYRLKVVHLRLPPLRERPEDVISLAAAFLVEFNRSMGRSVHGIAPEAVARLEGYRWPGNVRELRHVIERAFILYPGMQELRPEHLPEHVAQPRRGAGGPRDFALAATERRLLTEAIVRAGGNQTHAAKLLGISRFTFRYRFRKHGLVYGSVEEEGAEGCDGAERGPAVVAS